MQLGHGIQLAYCTNIHRGETWAETFANLNRHTLAVRERVAPGQPYAIGMRLSSRAACELLEPGVLAEFQHWLERHDCYVFTINGFPYGPFHGTSVKEQVYVPDWTTRERVEYTKRLFEVLARLVPLGMDGSVSTVPCSFKEFNRSAEQERAMRANLWECVEHMATLSQSSGRELHLGLEPEPLCYLETTSETVDFFERMRADRPGDARLDRHLGVNYDACHLAVEFEQPGEALDRLAGAGIRLSKVHLSSALRVHPTPPARDALRAFADATYLHQVVVRCSDGRLVRYRDLEPALSARTTPDAGEEWRIHFHVPLYNPPLPLFDTTSDHLLGVLDVLARDPGRCRHLEMETYTWEVLPAEFKKRGVVDQLVEEYSWTLERLTERGLGANDVTVSGDLSKEL
jgi:hypothetical protein